MAYSATTSTFSKRQSDSAEKSIEFIDMNSAPHNPIGIIAETLFAKREEGLEVKYAPVFILFYLKVLWMSELVQGYVTECMRECVCSERGAISMYVCV